MSVKTILSRSTQHRRGFSLIELLVVIGIIAILLGLLIPGVQMAREGARNLQCKNNMRQLGLAVHAYHDSFNVVPYSIGPWKDGTNWAIERNGKGWILSILPYLEQKQLYDELRPAMKGDFFSGGGLKVITCREILAKPIAFLRCPSDGISEGVSTSQVEWEGVSVATTNYKGVLGDSRLGGAKSQFTGSEPDCHINGPCGGMFWRVSYQKPVRFAHVSDGMSRTFLIGEDVPFFNARSAALYANGDHASCHAVPNYMPEPSTPYAWEDVVGFRSQHSGGLNFVYCDGSVRFIKDDVDMKTYQAQSTKAGKELFND